MVDSVIHLLFIGNSLTAANDLPTMVTSLARAAGVRVECAAVAKPDFSLEDHWNDGEARRMIARGGWTFVVLQQGPSALPESRVLLGDYVRRFDRVIRSAGAKTAVYMVWPSRERSADFDGVSTSYTLAAAGVDALLFPAGNAWQEAWLRDPSLALYGPDGFHPSPLGTALAALVIVEAVAGRAPPPSALPSADAHVRAVLLAAADAATRVRLRPARASESSSQEAASAGGKRWDERRPFLLRSARSTATMRAWAARRLCHSLSFCCRHPRQLRRLQTPLRDCRQTIPPAPPRSSKRSSAASRRMDGRGGTSAPCLRH